MPLQGSTETSEQRVRRHWSRAESAVLVEAFEAQELSQREFAAQVGVPHSTLQYWLARKANIDADPELAAFFESPAGLAFLHRLALAALFQFNQVGACGADQIGAFLKMAGLAPFLACSHASLQKIVVGMEAEIGEFGDTQQARLAADMPPREIAIAQDETFKPNPWLVAIELISGFILLERQAENRDAETWTEAMSGALAGLPVQVVLAVCDEARGLIAHVRDGLGAHQGPDLFHPQRDLWRALARPLRESLKAPAAALEVATARTANWQRRYAAHLAGIRRVGRPPDFERHIAEAEAEQDAARFAYGRALGYIERGEAAIRRISAAYHPVDLHSGRLRDAATVERELRRCFARLEETANAIDLCRERRKLIAKARRVMPKMVGTIAFFHAHVARRVAALPIDEALREVVHRRLIPALYLQLVAGRAAGAYEREQIRATAQRLLRQARTELAELGEEGYRELERVAFECASLFARSSSCVEGRNGQLALRHHAIHRLSSRRLKALTVIHNYHLRRADGTTAAERFFGAGHDELFEWLLDHLDVPARPRKRPSARTA